jgi:hypothetical protein
MFQIVLQSEMNTTVLSQNEVFKIVTVDCQLFNAIKTIMNSLVNLKVNICKNLTSNLVYGGGKFCWAVRNFLKCLQHALKMYTWSLSENQASVMFKCRLTALFLKQSLFRKHDFAVYLYKLLNDSQNVHFWHWKIFSDYQYHSHAQIREEHSDRSKQFPFYGGGKPLIFSSEELLPYTSTNLYDQQYQFVQCIKINDIQNPVLNNNVILCKVPLDVFAPKLTLKSVKNISIMHNLFLPSKILLKNAQILLQDHKCQCGEFLSVFKPNKEVSNAEYQQKWYQNHKEKRAEYNKQSQYQESHKKSSQKQYWSKKDIRFPPNPPSSDLCQQIVSDFCVDTSPEVFEEAGCAVCGKLTPICEMEELSDVENINLLKVNGVTRKARCKSSDPVRQLRGPILAPDCNRVCSICVESLEKKKVPTLALANGIWGIKRLDICRTVVNCKSSP